MSIKTPVLFMIFRRPDVTQQVFNEIRKAKPKQLFVCADGPRAHVSGEAQLCAQTRAIIDQVDWDCDVKKRFSEVNLGCRIAVSGALQWFFDHVDSGIILEDDCLPSQSFFWFCEEMLRYYHDDLRVMQISGAHFIGDVMEGQASYFFSRFNEISGWATWRRAWKHYDMGMAKYPEFRKTGRIFDYFQDRKQARWMRSYLDEAVDLEKCGVWSSHWTFAIIINNGLTICPTVPLSTHIGFNEQGTNFIRTSKSYPDIKVQEISKIIHPQIMLADQRVDKIKFRLIEQTDPHARWWYQLRLTLKMYLKAKLDPQTFARVIKSLRTVGALMRKS